MKKLRKTQLSDRLRTSERTLSRPAVWDQDSLGLLAEKLLGLWVVDQDLGQVLLVQDEQVSEAVGLHVSRAAVASAPCEQAGQSQHSEV